MSTDVQNARLRSSSTFHFVAGLSTGLCTAVILQPADLLKTRLQQPHRPSFLLTLRSILSGPNASGISGLWRGTLPSLLRTGLGSGLYFSSLSILRSQMAGPIVSLGKTSNLPRLSKAANLTTGAAARAAAGFALMPLTVIKVRYESSLYNYRSVWGACRDISAAEGIRGLFKGAGATAMRDAPYAGLYVLLYEDAKDFLGTVSEPDNHRGREGHDTVIKQDVNTLKAGAINLLAGVLAAAGATSITNPFDAVKTRLQLMPRKYCNFVAAGKIMIEEEGWRSLMDGLGLRMGRKAISSALAWTVYEELVRRAEARLGERT